MSFLFFFGPYKALYALPSHTLLYAFLLLNFIFYIPYCSSTFLNSLVLYNRPHLSLPVLLTYFLGSFLFFRFLFSMRILRIEFFFFLILFFFTLYNAYLLFNGFVSTIVICGFCLLYMRFNLKALLCHSFFSVLCFLYYLYSLICLWILIMYPYLFMVYLIVSVFFYLI